MSVACCATFRDAGQDSTVVGGTAVVHITASQ
jgi:hypothetical protein